MQFMMPIFDTVDGVWIVDHWHIAKQYCKGWFLIDIASIIPFDTLGLVINSYDASQLKVPNKTQPVLLFFIKCRCH